MPIVIWIIFVPVAIYSWMVANPLKVMQTVAHLKRRFRQHLISRHGKLLADDYIEQLRAKWARRGENMVDLEQLIEEIRPQLEEQLGTQYADEFLGEPTEIERYF
jgi:hypothetical protein